MRYRVPYGKTYLEFDLLPGMRGSVAEPRHVEPLEDMEGAIVQALVQPVGAPPLQEMVRPAAFKFFAPMLEEAQVVVVGSEYLDVVAACKMVPAATMEEALALAVDELGASLDVLIVPHALLTLPVVSR